MLGEVSLISGGKVCSVECYLYFPEDSGVCDLIILQTISFLNIRVRLGQTHRRHLCSATQTYRYICSATQTYRYICCATQTYRYICSATKTYQTSLYCFINIIKIFVFLHKYTRHYCSDTQTYYTSLFFKHT